MSYNGQSTAIGGSIPYLQLGGSKGYAEAPTPANSQIRDAISSLEDKVSMLEQVAIALNARFETVLAQLPPADKESNSLNAPQPAFSVLSRLHYLNDRVSYLTNTIGDIIQRAEV